MHTISVNNTKENQVIANALQANFHGIRVEIKDKRIELHTDNYVTAISIKAAFGKNGNK